MIFLGVLLLLVLMTGQALVFWGLIQVADAFRQPRPMDVDDTFIRRVAELEHNVDILPQRWEEMKKEVQRAENRARAVVRRARDELATHGFVSDAVEAEAGDLRLFDGDGSGSGGVQPVRREVAQPATPPVSANGSGLEAWELETLRSKYAR